MQNLLWMCLFSQGRKTGFHRIPRRTHALRWWRMSGERRSRVCFDLQLLKRSVECHQEATLVYFLLSSYWVFYLKWNCTHGWTCFSSPLAVSAVRCNGRRQSACVWETLSVCWSYAEVGVRRKSLRVRNPWYGQCSGNIWGWVMGKEREYFLDFSIFESKYSTYSVNS